MLQRGDRVPHFKVKTVDGGLFDYSTIWQRKNLLLVRLLQAPDDNGAYVTDLSARAAELRALETESVITRDDVSGVPAPGLLIADRWGEIAHITSAPESAQSPVLSSSTSRSTNTSRMPLGRAPIAHSSRPRSSPGNACRSRLSDMLRGMNGSTIVSSSSKVS